MRLDSNPGFYHVIAMIRRFVPRKGLLIVVPAISFTTFLIALLSSQSGTDSLKHANDNAVSKRCTCEEDILGSKNEVDGISFEKTTCSYRSFLRGSGQKIIGFSYYGDSRSAHHQTKKYFEGIQNNLQLLPKYYPNWIIRLYYDLSPDDPVLPKLCQLSCETNFDLCDIQRLPGTPKTNATYIFPMNWRFFPTLDPQVDFYLSRDLDSEFNDREISAVTEWVESDKSFHMMRDHPMHDIGMLGSAWGVRLTKEEVRHKWRKAWKNGFQNEIMYKARNLTGPDQGFLHKYVWPWAKKDAMQHDSYLCKHYSRTRAFPVQRKNESNNFVAAVVGEKQYIWQPCPEKCRPVDHKDWTYC